MPNGWETLKAHSIRLEHEVEELREANARLRAKAEAPDDLGIMRDASGLSGRCRELVRRLVKQHQRVEELEVENARLQAASHCCPISAHDITEDCLLELEGKLREVDRMGETQRANEAEAKLAKMVEALEWIADEYPDMGSGIRARAVLAACAAKEEK